MTERQMAESIFWYDFETTGVTPRVDRPLQVAGIRTDLDLNEIASPINYYCQLSPDILPHPQACLVTGITPDILKSQGLKEAEFFNLLHNELSTPQTCTAGYNSIRFDDEVTRYGLYRNFYDPYAREWQSGNSRWDIIDLVRTAYALRPEGIVWPEQEQQVSLRLELLTQANGIGHEQAHDALSDVRATIALAKLIKTKQPKLYDYLFALRSKREVQSKITLLKPILHISGMFGAARHFISPILPLAWHPTNRNALIVCDLQRDISPLLNLSAGQMIDYLYTKHEELPENISPIPLKLIHINRCPVIAPLTTLRPIDIERLNLDIDTCLQKAQTLITHQTTWHEKIKDVYQQDRSNMDWVCDDPEQQLYSGFLSERDKRLCEQLRQSPPQQLTSIAGQFEDERLSEMLFRYRARNYPETLTHQEQKEWRQFCTQRLMDPAWGAPNTAEHFEQACKEVTPIQTNEKAILDQWHTYVLRLQQLLQSDDSIA